MYKCILCFVFASSFTQLNLTIQMDKKSQNSSNRRACSYFLLIGTMACKGDQSIWNLDNFLLGHYIQFSIVLCTVDGIRRALVTAECAARKLEIAFTLTTISMHSGFGVFYFVGRINHAELMHSMSP